MLYPREVCTSQWRNRRCGQHPAALMAMVASVMGTKMVEALKPLVAAATKQTETAIQHKVELGIGKQYTSIEVAWIMGWSGVDHQQQHWH